MQAPKNWNCIDCGTKYDPIMVPMGSKLVIRVVFATIAVLTPIKNTSRTAPNNPNAGIPRTRRTAGGRTRIGMRGVTWGEMRVIQKVEYVPACCRAPKPVKSSAAGSAVILPNNGVMIIVVSLSLETPVLKTNRRNAMRKIPTAMPFNYVVRLRLKMNVLILK